MRKTIAIIGCNIFLLLPLFVGGIAYGQTSDKNELEIQLQQKTKMLEEIQNKKRDLEKTLLETNQSNRKLSDEIKKMDATIKELNLSIQENRIMIDKLNIEITTLGKDIINTEDSIRIKKETIAKLFAELQRQNDAGLISIIFRNKNLSETVAETQSIESINNELKQNLQDLNQLKGTLSTKLENQKDKKESRESEQENLKNRQFIFEDQKKEKQDLLKETKNQEKIFQNKLSELEKQQAAISNEVEQIESQLRKNINIKTLPGGGVLATPLPGSKMTQGYGATAFAVRNYGSKRHNGVDFGAPVGTPIYASEKGIVIATGNQDAYCPRGAYGKFVLVKHQNGLTTLYGHMSRYIVSIGTPVERGQLIGYVGSTGFATGPHLHFTVFATNTIPPGGGSYPEGTQSSRTCGPMPVGGDVNPLTYLAD